jgi:hypothetical protein
MNLGIVNSKYPVTFDHRMHKVEQDLQAHLTGNCDDVDQQLIGLFV